MQRRAAIWILGLVLLAPGSVPAQAPAAPPPAARPGRAPIYSADRRFMVSGMTSAENMVLAGKLAELAARIEEKTGQPLPLGRDQVLGVMVQSASAPGQQVLRMQGWDDGRFYQRLVAPSALRLDEEDLLEGAAWLLLNRHAAEHTPPGQRAGLGAAVPDWVSAGLFQNTQPALKSRNREWIARELAEGRSLPLAQVVKLESLPPGRWREKAYAAAAVEFLFPDGDRETWTALFRAAGGRQAIDPAWLRGNCPALKDRNPEQAWQAHLEERARTRTAEAWSDRSLALEEKLLQALNFKPRDLVAEVPAEVPADLFARDLIEYRGQAWVRPVAAALSLQVQSLKLGAPPVLQNVLASYAAYFDQLTTPPAEKPAWWRRNKEDPRKLRPPDDATWQVALNQLWQRAERAHQAFLEQQQSRRAYVDGFDRPDPGGLEPEPADDQPRTRLQRYVDEVEERASKPPF